MFTHPFMYNKIKKMPNITEKYAQKLIEEGTVNAEEVKVSAAASRSKVKGESRSLRGQCDGMDGLRVFKE